MHWSSKFEKSGITANTSTEQRTAPVGETFIFISFEQLVLPEAKYNLDAGSGMHGEQTGKMLAGIEKVLLIKRTAFEGRN
jgi:hypothetical protein